MADSDIADELLREVRRLRHELDDILLAHIRRFRDECHAHMKAWYEKVEAMVRELESERDTARAERDAACLERDRLLGDRGEAP